VKNRAIIISQGDELVSGRIQDTNSAWLSGKLWDMGILVERIWTVPDSLGIIRQSLVEAAARAEFVICSGGLGPTADDLTSQAAAEAGQINLEESQEALRLLEAHYAARGRELPTASRKMAQIPKGSILLQNPIGSAPGFCMEMDGSRLFFLPGVPVEMRQMFGRQVAPLLPRAAKMAVAELGTMGMGESELARRLEGMESEDLQLSYIATRRGNTVKLRFVSGEIDESIVEEAARRIGPGVFGRGCTNLAEAVGRELVRRGETVSLAESCTAGSLAAWLASVPGASRYLIEGVVVYSNAAKTRLCHVDQGTLMENGAVSRPVALQLAEGIRKGSGSDWGIGITGIAGPGGGSGHKPVGTVHVSVSGPSGTRHRAFLFHGTRRQVTDSASAHALLMLYRAMQEREKSTAPPA
jgi:nicotinamide-nucleotide amidase